MKIAVRVVVVVVIAAVAGWWAFAGGDEELAWADVARADLVVSVEVEGTLASRGSISLTPPQVPNFYDFKIAFMAPEGSQAAAGQPVLGFDASELQRQLLAQQNEAEQAAKNIDKLDGDLQQQAMELELRIAEAEAALRRAELKNEIPDDLRAANEARIAELDLEAARTEVESLKRQLAAARASGDARRSALVAQRDRAAGRVREIQASIASMMVQAPRPGTVIYATNWREEKKKVGDSAWRGERIIELPDLNRMMARGEVDEADAGRIAEGQPVTIRLDAHPDVTYRGRVESIWRTVQNKRGSRNPIKVVRLDIALDETDTARMRPGMRFRGSIEIERIPDAVVIPATAVVPSREGAVVYRRGMLGAEPVTVRLGARGGDRVQVLEGLAPGDAIAGIPPAR